MSALTAVNSYEPAGGYTLRVNGNVHHVTDGWIGESLLYVLRERLGFAAAKNACEQGECGSCSVMVDHTLMCACLVPAAAVGDRNVTTVEGLTPAGEQASLSIVQQAFVDAGAVQCGFCTPGLIMAVTDLLDRNPDPDLLSAQEAISGNLCRCTGYGRIIEAIRLASTQSSGGAANGEGATS